MMGADDRWSKKRLTTFEKARHENSPIILYPF